MPATLAVQPVSRKDNLFFPLPADYPDLTTEGKRQARVNACKLWYLPDLTKAERAITYVAVLNMFDQWYLWPDHEIGWDPLFYDDQPSDTPDFHWLIARQWISYRQNITIAPRGGAKSYLNTKDMLLRCLSRPAYSFFYTTSSHPNTIDTGQRIKGQLLHNKRINDDWLPEMPANRIVPKRGDATFSTQFMMLNNRSWIRLCSATSFQRGGRPRRYRLDDPEYDPRAETSMASIRDYMQMLLFKVVFPMITRPGTGVDWIGTYISKRHYLWSAMQTEETPEGVRAKDSRFNRWSRLHIPSEVEHEGRRVSCWADMWPATIADRMRMAETNKRYLEAISLEEIEESIGRANYKSEFLGDPGAADDSFFAQFLDYEDHGQHAYWYEDIDNAILEQPWRSSTLICWQEQQRVPAGQEPKWELKKMPLHEFLSEYTRVFMTADPAETAGPDSDSRVSTCMAVTPNNDLFVLDMWSKRCQQDPHVKAIFIMADAWRCPTVHPEAIRQGIALYNTLYNIVSQRAMDLAGNVQHLPAIRKFNPGMERKEDKISSLLFRFEYKKIKLPMWKRHAKPWSMFFDQVDEFNPDVRDGGLAHDDEIDSVAMSKFILKGVLAKMPQDEEDKRTWTERMVEGDKYMPDGTNIAEGIDIRHISYRDVEAILSAREARLGDGSNGPDNQI